MDLVFKWNPNIATIDQEFPDSYRRSGRGLISPHELAQLMCTTPRMAIPVVITRQQGEGHPDFSVVYDRLRGSEEQNHRFFMVAERGPWAPVCLVGTFKDFEPSLPQLPSNPFPQCPRERYKIPTVYQTLWDSNKTKPSCMIWFLARDLMAVPVQILDGALDVSMAESRPLDLVATDRPMPRLIQLCEENQRDLRPYEEFLTPQMLAVAFSDQRRKAVGVDNWARLFLTAGTPIASFKSPLQILGETALRLSVGKKVQELEAETLHYLATAEGMFWASRESASIRRTLRRAKNINPEAKVIGEEEAVLWTDWAAIGWNYHEFARFLLGHAVLPLIAGMYRDARNARLLGPLTVRCVSKSGRSVDLEWDAAHREGLFPSLGGWIRLLDSTSLPVAVQTDRRYSVLQVDGIASVLKLFQDLRNKYLAHRVSGEFDEEIAAAVVNVRSLILPGPDRRDYGPLWDVLAQSQAVGHP